MTLPGKITLCELEEDNPQKSYFRVRPLYTIENGTLEDAQSQQSLFPDEGGIRIVPDKNEAMRFKGRMRTLGGYCLMDLTGHPNENDKIRPNKNYSPERGETNRCIVYSDVICALGELDVMQVLSPSDAGKSKVAHTQRVLLRDKGKLKGPYVPELTPDKLIFGFSADVNNEPIEADENDVRHFKRADGEVEIYISPAFAASFAKAAPAQESAPKANEAAPQPKAEEPAPKVETPIAEKTPEAVKFVEKTPEPVQPAPVKQVIETKPEHIEAPASPKTEAAPPADKKPHRDPFEGQVGLNPRRSKSLSEVVDYFWRQSRIEQLGAAVSAEAVSSPVISPVEKAKKAIDEVWQLPEGRTALVKELLKNDSLTEAIQKYGSDATVSGHATSEELNELEAEKLELLRDIDKLKVDRVRQRGELMEETRAAHAKEIAELEMKEQKLREECLSRERAAQSARQAQAEAEKLMNRESKAKLDSEFLKFAMFTKAAALLKSEERLDIDENTGVPEVCDMTGAQMISDLRSAFEAGGRNLTNDEALNLLACLAIGSIVILSGPTGCGKSVTAHSLAGALGLRQKGAARFVRLDGDGDNARKSIGFREQMRLDDCLTQRFMLLEDINMKRVPDQSRGLLAFADEAKEKGVTLIMTCLDDEIGYPLQPRLLDRAFFIRLKPDEEVRWERAKRVPFAEKAPSLECVRRVFLDGNDVPAELKDRMETITKRLSDIGIRITPRAMNDMFIYCAAVCPLMTGDKLNALDLAIAQRALPHIMAIAKAEQIAALGEILCDMSVSLDLLTQPIALPPM